MVSFPHPAVKAAFDAFPDRQRDALLTMRTWIYAVAADLPHVGGLEETLKWGQPSYLGQKPRVGTTIRLGAPHVDAVAFYVSCQSTLVDQYRALFGPTLRFEKSRAVHLPLSEALPENTLKVCFRMAIEYHLDKRRPKTARVSKSPSL